MDKTDIKITRYEQDGFWIDIVENTEDFEAWLTAKNYGISQLMFGVPKKQPTWGDIQHDIFLELVENNFDEYAELYMINHGEEL